MDIASNNQSGCNIKRSGSAGSFSYSVPADYSNRPVTYVSWGSAARFCNWLHNGQPNGAQIALTTENGVYDLSATQQYYNPDGSTKDLLGLNAALMSVSRQGNWRWAIPTENEWYKAAYYKGGSTNAGYWDYATGSSIAPGRDLNDISGNNANYKGTLYPIQSPYYTTEVGEFQNSDSPYGTYDQDGNVWEWNETAINGSNRGIRGGAYNCDYDTLQASARDLYGASFTNDSVGFRVVAVPEPISLAMLAFGSMALIRRKWA